MNHDDWHRFGITIFQILKMVHFSVYVFQFAAVFGHFSIATLEKESGNPSVFTHVVKGKSTYKTSLHINPINEEDDFSFFVGIRTIGI